MKNRAARVSKPLVGSVTIRSLTVTGNYAVVASATDAYMVIMLLMPVRLKSL